MMDRFPPPRRRIYLRSAMAPTEAEIREARRHVADAERAVDDQRKRVETLRRNGPPTEDAEELLETFENVFSVMRKHLAVEEYFLEKSSF